MSAPLSLRLTEQALADLEEAEARLDAHWSGALVLREADQLLADIRRREEALVEAYALETARPTTAPTTADEVRADLHRLL